MGRTEGRWAIPFRITSLLLGVTLLSACPKNGSSKTQGGHTGKSAAGAQSTEGGGGGTGAISSRPADRGSRGSSRRNRISVAPMFGDAAKAIEELRTKVRVLENQRAELGKKVELLERTMFPEARVIPQAPANTAGVASVTTTHDLYGGAATPPFSGGDNP